MKSKSGGLGSLFVEFVVQTLFWLLLPVLIMGCFVVFDRFEIRETWQQVALVVSPLFIAGYFLWRRDARKARKQRASSRSGEEMPR